MSDPFGSKETKTMIFNMLKVLGGHTVEVRFQGGGDSGEIEDACLLDANDNEISMDGITYDWPTTKADFDHAQQKWVETTEIKPTPLSDILRDATETMLEQQGLDWYNNDGGQGSMTIDLSTTPPTVTLNVGINYTQTDEHEYDYTDGDDEYDEGEETVIDPEVSGAVGEGK